MNDQKDTATARTTLVVLRTVTGLLGVSLLLVGFLMSMSSPDSTAANAILGAGLVFGTIAVGITVATGGLRRLSLGTAVILTASVLLLGLVLVDLANG